MILLHIKSNKNNFCQVRTFSGSPFKENNRDKLKKYILGLFNSLISKFLSVSTKKSAEEFIFFLKKYDQKIAEGLSPLNFYQKTLLIPSFVYLLSHILLIFHGIEIQLLGIEPNEAIINLLSYPKEHEEFITFAACSAFLCMLSKLPTQIKETKKVIQTLTYERDEAEKNGTPFSKMQKRAIFTAVGKVTIKNAAKTCALCAGALVTTDACADAIIGYRPVSEASMVLDGVITTDQYANHINNRSLYRTINSDYGIGPAQADKMAKDFLAGKIKLEHSEYDKYLDITKKVGFEQKSK